MRTLSFHWFVAVTLVVWCAASTAWAGDPPEYEPDPFADADFQETELILEQAFPTKGRGEIAIMFSSSMIDKYTSHIGMMADLNWHFTETFGVGLSVGYLHGSLTSIVTDPAGIIGNKVQSCIGGSGSCNEINPNVPDYKQVTGVIDVVALWSPLYGKINLVSELDINLQLFILGGLGVNGTRTIQASTSANPSSATDYQLVNDGFGEGGFLGDVELNGTIGVGLRIFLADWIALRGEVRGILFGDEFDFNVRDPADNTSKYVSDFWFIQIGLAAFPF